jgi:methylthioribose-1-phosphate isomerase
MSNTTPLERVLRTIAWEGDHAVILDQTALPTEQREKALTTMEDAFEAIRTLQVRGAPLIGVTAAFGLYLGMREALARPGADPAAELARCVDYLAGARPTAVNLTWALRRAAAHVTPSLGRGAPVILAELLAFAQSVLRDDVAANRAMGVHGLPLLQGKKSVLTHCNAGWLATAGYGTATAPLYLLRERGEPLPHVYVDETRPVLQGSRLTAWELNKAGFPVTLICDDMAATVMAGGRVEAVIVGCDRMAANGDFANKIGTLGVAILAREFGLPLYVAAPTSSIDFDLPTGAGIPIEERAPTEVRQVGSSVIAPEVAVYNPAFDVTPHRYVAAIITEHGVVTPPFDAGLRRIRASISGASGPQ